MALSDQNIALMVMLTIFSLFGAIGNGLVAYVYAHKAKKDSATIFILALSCTDLLACLLTIPYTAVKEGLQNKLNYDLACKLYKFLITFNVPLSAFLMVVISVDRYFSICHSLLQIVTPQRAKIVLLLPVFVAATFGSITSLTDGVYITITLNLQCASDDLIVCLNQSGTRDYIPTIEPILNRTTAFKESNLMMISAGTVQYAPDLFNDEDATVTSATTMAKLLEESMSNFSEHLYTRRDLTSTRYPEDENIDQISKRYPESEIFYQKSTRYPEDENIDQTDTHFPTLDSITLVSKTSDSTTPKMWKITVDIYSGGFCVFSPAYLSHDALLIFQKVYASFYLISFTVVLAFYFRIYVFVVQRRRVRRRQKIPAIVHSSDELKKREDPTTKPKIVINVIPSDLYLPDDTIKLYGYSQAHSTFIQNNQNNDFSVRNDSKKESKNSFIIAPGSRSKYEKERVNNNDRVRAESMLSANVRTAAMLFVVTAVFMLCFLPAWLMAIKVITLQVLVFYSYFFYNVANPLIYAFMNKTFRKEMKRILRIRGASQQRS